MNNPQGSKYARGAVAVAGVAGLVGGLAGAEIHGRFFETDRGAAVGRPLPDSDQTVSFPGSIARAVESVVEVVNNQVTAEQAKLVEVLNSTLETAATTIARDTLERVKEAGPLRDKDDPFIRVEEDYNDKGYDRVAVVDGQHLGEGRPNVQELSTIIITYASGNPDTLESISVSTSREVFELMSQVAGDNSTPQLAQDENGKLISIPDKAGFRSYFFLNEGDGWGISGRREGVFAPQGFDPFSFGVFPTSETDLNQTDVNFVNDIINTVQKTLYEDLGIGSAPLSN